MDTRHAVPTTDITCRPCTVCGQRATVTVATHDHDRWVAGALVQDAFPEMPPDDRELLVSGTHPECWERLFRP